ncbi:hypothetical protein TNCV_3746081 [Trichonephila clavipes]|nr:hypothetical protein TNCV_3746081 [Trichonephila clavipes]
MKQIIKDLDKFYLKIAIKYGMPIEAFNQFRSYVATEIRELDFTVENEIMYKDLKSSIENIQNDFVITYVDTVSANYAIICKYFYSKLLCNHILNKNSFQKSIHSNREDDNRLLALNKRLNIHLNNIKYPSIQPGDTIDNISARSHQPSLFEYAFAFVSARSTFK